MSHTILLISHNCINIYILYALENVSLYKRVHLFQVTDQFLDFHTFGAVFVIAGSTGICKFTCTLNKMEIIVVTPCLNIILPHQIQWTDQLHSLKVGAVKLGHHSLYLGTVKHSHKNGLNHIIIVVTQCNLVAAHFFCKSIEMPAAHSCAKITRGFLHIKYRLKNIRLKNTNRNI